MMYTEMVSIMDVGDHLFQQQFITHQCVVIVCPATSVLLVFFSHSFALAPRHLSCVIYKECKTDNSYLGTDCNLLFVVNVGMYS